MNEITLTEKEAKRVNDGFNDPKDILNKENTDDGFCLTVRFEGKKYDLWYDHQTWFTGVGYEIIEA